VPEVSFSVWREPVQDEWIDYNGHLSEPWYVLVMGHATDAVMDAIGLGPGYQAANDASLYTVEAHVRYLDEIHAGVELEVRSAIIGVAPKLLWIWHELWADDRLRATEEILGLHVSGGSSSPLPDEVVVRARAACVEPPAEAGRRIGPVPRPDPLPAT
jgi:acyl-CoA thioester hydrolase